MSNIDNENVDHPSEYQKLTDNERQAVHAWIVSNFTKADTYWRVHSYFLKDVFRKSPSGFYLTNGAFKGAMIAAGFSPKHPNHQNWVFNVKANEPLVNAYFKS